MRAEPRQDLGSAPTPEGSTPLSAVAGFSPELIEEAQRVVSAPYTKTIPWSGTSQMLVACGPGLEARKFARAFLEAVNALTRSEGVTDAVATPKDSGGGR